MEHVYEMDQPENSMDNWTFIEMGHFKMIVDKNFVGWANFIFIRNGLLKGL